MWLCLAWHVPVAHPQSAATRFRFDFGPGKVARGYTQVVGETAYSKERGYGFEPGAAVTCFDRGGRSALRSDFCTSDAPFLFSVDVPEGNYRVKLTLGDAQDGCITTVKAESRRLMFERVETPRGKFATRTFTVNVRNGRLPNGGTVSLNEREIGVYHWDNKLTLEFNNKRPCVAAMEISRVEEAITVFLAGDSTVTDQTREPYAAWGQMLPRFFKSKVAVANYAESGETLKAFLVQHRLEKLLSQMKAGDYLFIQFAHNDQKPGGNHVDAFTTYQERLKLFIGEARNRGGIPVLVTSMLRRRFDDAGKIINTLEDYPEAMRRTAKEENVALIDLTAMSRTFYEALGPENSTKAFVHYPAGTYPGQTNDLKDDTHFNNYGAYELAKCIVEGIRANKLSIAKYLYREPQRFDPAHPDPVEAWNLPASPPLQLQVPLGR